MLAWQPPTAREPASSDRLPVHRCEAPTGYSSAGCSPAEPASASPVSENISSIPTRRGNQMRCSTSARMQFRPSPRVWLWRPRPPCPPPTRVSSLLCAPGVISILRRQTLGGDLIALRRDLLTAFGQILDQSDDRLRRLGQDRDDIGTAKRMREFDIFVILGKDGAQPVGR